MCSEFETSSGRALAPSDDVVPKLGRATATTRNGSFVVLASFHRKFEVEPSLEMRGDAERRVIAWEKRADSGAILSLIPI